ncbi:MULTISPECIES: NADH-quinone oxidoreductase subunit C [unclassified Spirosoma]|uniref:NADH-quinone oxidoreductase subunit C n=1 Tax=unclassified Spirosoma TaxID=2621999 RepID=UPI00096615C1|nr:MULTISPECIES: NADH-quinone oxidoreductase subunit C [unclassified Spirosoma]MBN8824694.1 NADH-quinone oxidoreductase subunit C [Spirosoma sp.]OJW78760.1 MAG: NADH dehydrogenase [Spirosoma sp. 48-14]
MTFLEITDLLNNQFSSDFQTNTQNPQPYLTIPANQLTNVCQFLRDDDRLFFDLLACVTGIDNGVEANTMEVIYNLTSIPYAHDLMLKVIVPRNTHSSKLPSVPSVSHIWRTADWHERETFDLVGIQFENHPDLRRILLPTDWEGHPLRTDYEEQEQYHGIKTK